MADNLFQEHLTNPEDVTPVTNEQIENEINQLSEEEYLRKQQKVNKPKLIKLDPVERERVAQYITGLYEENRDIHADLCNRIDKYDDIYRMKRMAITDAGDDTPNYRTPLSTVTLEVIHANVMNVFFTPSDVMRVLPTEEGDIPKIKKLDTFGNWSMKNELFLFSACDKLFHGSAKCGEKPYYIHWVKEYGTIYKDEVVMNPADPRMPMIDVDTGEVVKQQVETQKLLYDGPRLEVFSRKDYILPKNYVWGKVPPWEMRRVRYNADTVYRRELEGKYYAGTFDDIGGWGTDNVLSNDNSRVDFDGKEIPLNKTEKIFVEFCGKMRVHQVKTDKKGDESYEELEDEVIGVVEVVSRTLCSLRKNEFPMKIRPFDMDVFLPDDEGRGGIGVIEFMESLQNCYDLLYNQYLFGVTQSNSPFGFFAPTGNMKDKPIKAKAGYLYPSSDPGSINMVKIPSPDQSLQVMMEEVRNGAQMLFGIGDYQAGLESQIDPSAPAKKAELVVAQGNVRLNMIIKRKNKTLENIFKRWFLLYQANMPENKFMRIAGADRDNPWEFTKMNLSDFALQSIPDFELTGNVLNSNKALEAQKATFVYDRLNVAPEFNPATADGMRRHIQLLKWYIDKLDESGVSKLLPAMPGDRILTPQEENARFLQGDDGEPDEGEDHVMHLREHVKLIVDPTVPEEVKKVVIKHIEDTQALMRNEITKQIVLSQAGNPQGGAYGDRNAAGGAGTNPNAATDVPVGLMAGVAGGNPTSLY